MKIKGFKKTNDWSKLLDLVGAEFTFENSEYQAFLLDVDENEEFPLQVSIKLPVGWKEFESIDFEGNVTTIERPNQFEEILLDNFKITGESESGNYKLSEVSISRITNFLLDVDEYWKEEKLNDEESNFKEIIEKYGFCQDQPIFVTVSDTVANSATVPDENFRESCTLRVDWIYRMKDVSEDGEIFSLERALGVINYIDKETEEIVKRNVFLAFYDEEMSTCNVNQVESIRPSTPEEIYLWFQGNANEPSVIPLMINENDLTLEKDPALDFTIKDEEEQEQV